MKDNLVDKRDFVATELRKYFDYVWYIPTKRSTIFCCALSSHAIPKDSVYRFPISSLDLETCNSYDIVNAIWEYITETSL